MITEGPRNEQHNWRGGVSDRVGPAGRMQRIQAMLGSRQAPLGYSHGRAYITMAFFLACSLTCAAGHVKSEALYTAAYEPKERGAAREHQAVVPRKRTFARNERC